MLKNILYLYKILSQEYTKNISLLDNVKTKTKLQQSNGHFMTIYDNLLINSS